MAELSVPRLDFSVLGQLPNIYQANRQQALKELALADLGKQGGNINYSDAARRLLSAGLTQEGMTLASLGNNERDFAFRQTEAERAQRNAERGFGLQERQIAATAGNAAATRALAEKQFQYQVEQGNRPEIREVTDANGNKSLVLVNRKDPFKVQTINVPGQNTEPNNPFMAGGPMKEEEAKAALYANRMLASERELRKVESAGTSWWNKAASTVSEKTGYNVRNQEMQKFDQAQRDFINAVLRRESGAVISADEFANARQQYFPQPGDTAETLAQKRANRIEAIRGIGASAGRGYKPTLLLDPQGNVVERGAAPQERPPQQFNEGATATNPQTGQKIMFRGGQWVPVK